MIYANNAATTWPKPDAVQAAVAQALANPPHDNTTIYAQAHARVRGFLGIEDPDRLLFTQGCTAALALLLADLDWAPGDVVITSALEHHALTGPIRRLVAARGIVHAVSPYRPGTPIDLDFVAATLARGKVRLVAASAASNITGEILPISDLAALAHEYGALCMVDAAQTVGVVPVDVRRLGVDLLVFAGHKGPLGPLGIGGLWAAPGLRFPGFCDLGSANMPALAGLAAGLEWLEAQPGPLGAKPRALARSLIKGIATLPACELLGAGHDKDAKRTATVSIRLNTLALDQTEAYFADRGIIVRAGRHCARPACELLGVPDGVLRISFGPFNRASDVDAILAALRALG